MQRVGNIVRSNVRKKKDEVALWELATPERKQQTKDGRESVSRQGRSVQGIGQDGSAQRNRQGKQTQANGRSRSVQIIGQDEPAQPNRQRKRTQVSGQDRTAQSLIRRKARRRRAYLYRAMSFFMAICCMALVFVFIGFVYNSVQEWKEGDIIPAARIPIFNEVSRTKIESPEISIAFLEVNDYSRPGTALKKVKNIFVHYTANPGTSAAQNRSYFANLAQTRERSASAHYIIGYEGEIIQCIPLEEQAYAVMTRNEDSISIECCYLEEDGEFTQETYDSLVHMLAWLIQEYKLDSSDILRHYDCGGKLCPLYYVEHEDAWEQLLADVDEYGD